MHPIAVELFLACTVTLHAACSPVDTRRMASSSTSDPHATGAAHRPTGLAATVVAPSTEVATSAAARDEASLEVDVPVLPTPPSLDPATLAGLPTGQITPFADELLPHPIPLEGCDGVQIVEWRPRPGAERSTGPSWPAVDALAATCRAALEAFDTFVADESPFPPPPGTPYRIDVSLLPTGATGPTARTIADHDGRFASRERTLDHDGRIVRISGYAHFASRFVFVRHDVLTDGGAPNEATLEVFAHELFHAMSWQSGLFAQHPVPRGEADERLARRFTASLGIDP